MEIVSKVLQIVLEYLVPLAVVSFLGFVAVKSKPLFEDKTTRAVVSILVNAAEQLYEAGHGEEKLSYVLKQAEEWLKKYNITLDMERLRALVEAEVLKVNLEQKLVK